MSLATSELPIGSNNPEEIPPNAKARNSTGTLPEKNRTSHETALAAMDRKITFRLWMAWAILPAKKLTLIWLTMNTVLRMPTM